MDADIPASPAALQGPGSAAIGRFVKSVGRRGIKNSRILRIDHQVVEANAHKRRRGQDTPRRAAVSGFVNAGAEVVVEVPFAASGMRAIVLPPCPMTNIAFMVSGWETWSFGSKVASNQRVLVTPGVSMKVLLTKRESIQS